MAAGPLCLRAQSEEAAAAPKTALSYLNEHLGAAAADILEARGYVVLAGKTKSRRLVHVQWKALELLLANRKDLLVFIKLFDSRPAFDTAPEDIAALRRLKELPSTGLLTPAMHSAVDVIAAHLQEAAALPKKAPAGTENGAFSTRWGEEFRAEFHAELLTDFTPLAEDYFTRVLSLPEADAHFRSYMQDVRGLDAGILLDQDQAAGELSRKTSLLIASYLLDQKRLWNLAQTAHRLKDILRSSGLRADLDGLRGTLPAAGDHKSILKGLRTALEEQDRDARIRFRGTDLHVHAADGGAQQNTGDRVVVSLAYWIEGANSGERIDVSATGFIDDREQGVRRKIADTKRLGSGGPYTFTTEVTLESPYPVAYRFYLSAPGAETLEADVTIGVSPSFQDTVTSLAEADGLVSRCQLNKAEKALQDARGETAALAGREPFKKLLTDIDDRRKELARRKEARGHLKGSLDSVHLYASREHCDYQPDRAERALALMKRLPPGCDQIRAASGQALSQHIVKLLRRTSRRRHLQDAFSAAAAKARELERNCSIQEAADMYTSALALLESDPGARCGEWETDFERIRLNDLRRVGRASAVRDAIERTISNAEKAFAQGHYAAALSILHPLRAGIDALDNAGCYGALKEQAEKVAQAAGLALPPRPAQDLKELLPSDPIAKPLEDVRRASRRLREERRRQQETETSFEGPNTPDEEEPQ
ncbi:MAG: hypothetical protein ABIJ96_03310 [Elusimicrobiota bacterium]